MFAAQCAHSNTLTAHFIPNTEHQAHRTHYAWNICMQIAISQTIRFYTYAYVSSRQKYAALPFYGFQLSSKWKREKNTRSHRENAIDFTVCSICIFTWYFLSSYSTLPRVRNTFLDRRISTESKFICIHAVL